jgi:hypothetical protein
MGELAMKNHKYLPLKGMGKVHSYSLARKCRLASFLSMKHSPMANIKQKPYGFYEAAALPP